MPNLSLATMATVMLATVGLAFGVLLADSLAAAVAVLLLLAPFHELPGISAEQLRLGKQLMTFAIIGLWLVRRALGAHGSPPRNPMLYAIVPYAGLLVASSLVSGALSASLQAATADIALMALFLCVSDVTVEERTQNLLLIAAVGSLSLGSAIVLWHAPQALIPAGPVPSFSMLALSAPLAFAMVTEPTVRRRWIWLPPLLVMTGAALVADHRGAIVAMGASIAGIALYRWRWSIVPIGVAALATAVLLFGDVLDTYFRTNAGLTGRPSVWLAAIRIFGDHPLTGSGPGSFSSVYQAYQPSLLELPLQSRPLGALPHAHNIFLNALAELGFMGPVCIGFLLGSAIWIAYRLWREESASGFDAGLALGLLATIAAVCIQELTESGTIFRNGSQNIFFWTFLGLVVGIWRSGRPAPEFESSGRIQADLRANRLMSGSDSRV